jgi:molybdopterin-containing oxidoreductase family iron-sulfur binding subunit
MSINRRDFLKKAGLITALGVGGATFGLNGLDGLRPAEASDNSTQTTKLKAKRWAMVIDMKEFKTDEDYQRVIDACHKLHNVPKIDDPKSEIKWIWTEKYENVFMGQDNPYLDESTKELPFLTLCNHCDNPPCVRACPTQATFKRPDGIVGMDFHRCIGCRFCMAACPFGARSFNFTDPRASLKEINPEYPTRTKGVVEKCNFCMERIDKGLKPACVEASKGAIVFGDLDDPNSEVRKLLSTHYTIRRKPNLGTEPSVFYMIGGEANA